jgi:probable rRNA maturation factor
MAFDPTLPTPPAAPAPHSGPSPSEAPELDLAFSQEVESEAIRGPLAETSPLIASPNAETLWTALFREWLADLAPELPPTLRAPAYSLGLSLVDDAAIAAFNTTWRHQAGATDVLAFAAQDDAPPLPPRDGEEAQWQPLELGDIVISLETAARQATAHQHSLHQELLFLASHGLLHLLGWDHPDETSLEAMLARQEELLAPNHGLPALGEPCAGGASG